MDFCQHIWYLFVVVRLVNKIILFFCESFGCGLQMITRHHHLFTLRSSNCHKSILFCSMMSSGSMVHCVIDSDKISIMKQDQIKMKNNKRWNTGCMQSPDITFLIDKKCINVFKNMIYILRLIRKKCINDIKNMIYLYLKIDN
jgi:hypothetical protein